MGSAPFKKHRKRPHEKPFEQDVTIFIVIADITTRSAIHSKLFFRLFFISLSSA